MSLALAARAAGQQAARPPERPNILVIISDQLAQRAVGAYGDRWASTPNIDSLAAGGVRFSRSYTNCPLCQPSRASFWTGRLPHETGVDSNGLNYPVPIIPLSMPTLGAVFSAAGYETVNFGKQHDAGALRGFRLVEPEEVELEAPEAWPVNNDSRQDPAAARKCVEFLKGPHQKPFLAVASLNNPHNICGWVGHNVGVHRDLPVPGELPPLPDNFEIDDLASRPLPIQYLCCSHRRLQQAAKWSETNYRHYLAAYYHYLEMADTLVGEILQALYSTPQGENTLVVFFADHGDSMASHRMVTKQVSFYEETSRVPFILAGPGVGGRGRLVGEPLVSLLDLLPTLCDYAGLAVPGGLQGTSLLPWVRGDNPGKAPEYVAGEWQTEWGYTVSPGRMIRTDRYKYTRYLEGDGEELYDLASDPGEKRNLAPEQSYAAALAGHRDLLQEHLQKTADPFFSLEVKADRRWRSHEPGYWNHEGLSAPEAAWEEEEKNR
ncbi:MAG: sulfatase-like hydrolase/transferase [Candidatus Glassbacteria bacterium]|nr:sulfatase-like hydrolase/transferase [Candidatus Glassbacteria bacterium]